MISEMFVTQENELLPASKKKACFVVEAQKPPNFEALRKNLNLFFFNQRMIHFFGFVFQNCFFFCGFERKQEM